MGFRNFIKSSLLFFVYNGGELHQLYTVYKTQCTLGMVPVRYIALCFSHLVAAGTHSKAFDRESMGLLFICLQHLVLSLLTTNTVLNTTNTVLLLVLVVLVWVVLRSCARGLGMVLYNLTPFYTTLVKVYQLYTNYTHSSTGMISPISTLHILLLSILFLLQLPTNNSTNTPTNTKLRVILAVCLVTNGLQLVQWGLYNEHTKYLLNIECGL